MPKSSGRLTQPRLAELPNHPSRLRATVASRRVNLHGLSPQAWLSRCGCCVFRNPKHLGHMYLDAHSIDSHVLYTTPSPHFSAATMRAAVIGLLPACCCLSRRSSSTFPVGRHPACTALPLISQKPRARRWDQDSKSYAVPRASRPPAARSPLPLPRRAHSHDPPSNILVYLGWWRVSSRTGWLPPSCEPAILDPFRATPKSMPPHATGSLYKTFSPDPASLAPSVQPQFPPASKSHNASPSPARPSAPFLHKRATMAAVGPRPARLNLHS